MIFGDGEGDGDANGYDNVNGYGDVNVSSHGFSTFFITSIYRYLGGVDQAKRQEKMVQNRYGFSLNRL